MATDIIPVEQLVKSGIESFKQYFKAGPTCIGCAPGRVNLIGEHTDYNDGFVFPMALPMVTLVIGRKVTGDKCSVVTISSEIDSKKELNFSAHSAKELTPGSCQWGNYVLGVVANFPAQVPGFEAIITSTVPVGGGLSSSAALEVAVYTFLEALTGKHTKDQTVKALYCQKAEHDFAKVPCGLMDQYIAVMGKKGQALLIDCRPPARAELVELKDPSVVFVVIDSGVRHSLGDSEYPKRREECAGAARALGVVTLREASLDRLKELDEPGSEVMMKRARHVMTEISRTYQAAKALSMKDYSSFGLLMNQSHHSLKEDYEVSCKELDQIVDAAVSCDGVFGCRMTGGGFGGCAIALVKKESAKHLIETVKNKFKGEPKFYIATPSEGARVIEIPV